MRNVNVKDDVATLLFGVVCTPRRGRHNDLHATAKATFFVPLVRTYLALRCPQSVVGYQELDKNAKISFGYLRFWRRASNSFSMGV